MSHDPVKKPRLLSLISLHDKSRDILASLARFTLVLCIVSSISIVIYAVFFSSRHAQNDWLRAPKPVRRPGPETETEATDISHILFCLGGSAATWRDRSRYSSIWWAPNVTRGYVWLDEVPGKKNNVSAEISAPGCKVSAPEWTKFRFSSSRSAVRIARIIKDCFNLGMPRVRWFVMGDDDTVYFTRNLVSVLARYDHSQMWYIGENSESVEQDAMHSYDMAFGGGGFAVSYPLAERLVSILDGCLDRYYYFYGSDQRIWACISEIGVPLTRERGFHQFDIRGSPYGLLAAHPPAPLVSLHHLDYLDPLFPNQSKIDSLKSLYDAHRLDPARTLQQTFCHDYNRKWSISIAWGYTVQLYPSLLPAKDLQTPLRTFKTWRSWSNGPFTFNTRPMSSDPCQQPIVFMLDHAQEVGERGTLTVYKTIVPMADKICNRADYSKAMKMQRIHVSSMKLDPDYWTKAPRRQCCQFMDRGNVKSREMQIRIRNCRTSEAVTT